MSVATAPSSQAEGSGVIQMPLADTWRACDGTALHWVVAREDGRGTAQLSTSGSHTLSASFSLVTAQPDTHYDVRIIQVPRSSQNCAPGDPGVIAGGFQTDSLGAGGTTIAGPIQNGATGAWVIIDRPSANSQTPAEYYSSTFIAAI